MLIVLFDILQQVPLVWAILVPIVGACLILERRLTRLETTVAPFVKAIEEQVAKILHHPEPEHGMRDRLLEDFQAGLLDREGARMLQSLVLPILRDPNAPPLEVAAAMLLTASIDARLERGPTWVERLADVWMVLTDYLRALWRRISGRD